MGVVAIVNNGVWTAVTEAPQSACQKTDTHVANASIGGEVDQIVALLGQVVQRAQNLSETDARRVRNIVHAAQGMLMATTYLEKPDQRAFERSLREAANRRY